MTCGCGCGSLEALGNCATPKVELEGNIAKGSVTICANLSGVSFPAIPVIIVNGTTIVGFLERSGTFWHLNYTNALGIAAAASVNSPVIPDCESFTVSWEITEGTAPDGSWTITANGVTASSGPAGISIWLDGIAYAVAPAGNAWSLGGDGSGPMDFGDNLEMEFKDGQHMLFAP